MKKNKIIKQLKKDIFEGTPFVAYASTREGGGYYEDKIFLKLKDARRYASNSWDSLTSREQKETTIRVSSCLAAYDEDGKLDYAMFKDSGQYYSDPYHIFKEYSAE